MNELFEQRGAVDMSREAVAQRLRDLQQLYLFSISLSRARFIEQPTQRTAPQIVVSVDSPVVAEHNLGLGR